MMTYKHANDIKKRIERDPKQKLFELPFDLWEAVQGGRWYSVYFVQYIKSPSQINDWFRWTYYKKLHYFKLAVFIGLITERGDKTKLGIIYTNKY